MEYNQVPSERLQAASEISSEGEKLREHTKAKETMDNWDGFLLSSDLRPDH